ncbi:GlxA family transcriptional regulator [Microbaculum sp. FT89]|uniref:GlxA family transcriptional regulator n=1 Tax=Microbaculum sp. FT89 TaxID=3447298 RepID=UPI003F533F30
MSQAPENGPYVVAFGLVERFSLMSEVAAIDTMRIANRLLGRDVYRWQLLSLSGGPVTASNGIRIECEGGFDVAERADLFFICAGLVPLPQPLSAYHAALQRVARANVALGGLSTGTFLLASAGLLDGYRCTVHWENRPAFMEMFPGIDCTAKVYEIDRDRYTTSGGAASVDLILQIVTQQHGADLAAAIANQLQHDRIRPADEEQRLGNQTFLHPLPGKLRMAIEIMTSHLEAPLATATIAYRTGLSARQLERLFQRYLQVTPARYYMRLRLERARDLLLHTNVPILDVAVATGFTSSSYFSQCYRQAFVQTPSATRRIAVMAGERTDPRGASGGK